MMGAAAPVRSLTTWAHVSIVVRLVRGVEWVDGELHVGKVAVMLTSRSRSTEVDSGQGAALPRRVPGASQRELALPPVPSVAADDVASGLSDRPSVDLDVSEQLTPELDLAGLPDLPDVSSLLARLVDERIPMALLIDLVNPAAPVVDDEVDRAPSDVG